MTDLLKVNGCVCIYTHKWCMCTCTHVYIKIKSGLTARYFFQAFAESLQVIAPTDQISEVEF